MTTQIQEPFGFVITSMANLCLALFVCSLIASTPLMAESVRLSGDAIPLHESVTFDVDPSSETFRGHATIDVRLVKPSATIELNATELTIDSAVVHAAARTQNARVEKIDDDVIRVIVPEAIPSGIVTIDIGYQGLVTRKNMRGLFARESEGRWYLLSQFEEADARRAMPCFDEPRYKIPWSIAIRVPSSLLALSNATEVYAQDEGNGKKLVSFRETAPLPSYLVAIAAGPFDVVDLGDIGRKPVHTRMVVAHDKAAEVQWAANATKKIVPMLEDYFDRAYPFDKLDLIEVPESGLSIAMENAGLVTFGDSYLLAKQGEESTRFRHESANTIAHELAHQWFGDLVTMSWWNDIWLNESFANWLGDKIEDRFTNGKATGLPEIQARQWAMSADEVPSAPRVRRPIETRADFDTLLNPFVYVKGESLLVMFESWLGEEQMRKGVQLHMSRHAWGNATASDFLSSLAEGSGNRDVPAAFASFLDQPGEPVVSVDIVCGTTPHLALTQKPYSTIGHPHAPATWQIPVCVRTSTGETCTLMRDGAASVALESCPSWIVAGNGGHSYYRQHLSPGVIAAAAPNLNALEEMALLDDAGSLAQNGEMKASEALGIARSLAKDHDPRVVSASIVLMKRLALWAPDRKAFASIIRTIYGPAAREAGWQPRAGENDDTRTMRRDVLTLVTDLGDDTELAKSAVPLATTWLTDRTSIDPDLRDTIVGIALRSGGDALLRQTIAALRQSSDVSDRRAMFRALGGLRDPSSVRAALALTLDPNIPISESARLLFSLGEDERSRPVVMQFIDDHYAALAKRLPNDIFYPSVSWLPRVALNGCDNLSQNWVERLGTKIGNSGDAKDRVQSVSEAITACKAAKTLQSTSLRSAGSR